MYVVYQNTQYGTIKMILYVNFKLFCDFEQVVTYQKWFLEQALHMCSTK